jgi:hypothetical protein
MAIIIHKDQMEALGRVELRKFEDKMVLHLRQFFPQRCQELGEAGTRQSIRHGVERAEAYGLTAERDVTKYVDVMFVYGQDFDQDPSQRWAQVILTDGSLKDTPAAKASRLHEEAVRRLARSGGEESKS